VRTRFSPGLAAALTCLFLAGCARNSSETAWALIQHQQEQQALVREHEAREARDNAPTEPQLMMAMVREAQRQGRYFAALAYIDAYAARFKPDAELQAMRADALRMTDQKQASTAAYQALLRTSKAAEGWHGLGLLAAQRGDYGQAVESLAKAATLRPTDAQMLNDLGYARLHAGDVAGARLPLGQAAELDSSNPKVLANLALLLLLDGKAAQAQEVMTQAGLAQAAKDEIHRQAVSLRAVPRASYEAAAPSAAMLQPLHEHQGHVRLTRQP